MDNKAPVTPERNADRFGPNAQVGDYTAHRQDERIATGRLTLGFLIDALTYVDPKMPVATDTGHALSSPHSYRGYNVDLAFVPRDANQTAKDLLAVLRGCVGAEFVGWKGGEYRMSRDTPLWLSHRGDTGRYLIGVDPNPDGEGLLITTASEYDEDDD